MDLNVLNTADLNLAHEIRRFWLGQESNFRAHGLPFRHPSANLELAGEFYRSDVLDSSFEKLIKFCSVVAAQPAHDTWSDTRFAQVYLEEIGLRFPEEFMRTVRSDDLVEIYDFNDVQIFRNMSFMKICGYSLSDIATFPWPHLYERSQIHTKKIQALIGKVIDSGGITNLPVTPHLMKERFSETRQVVRVTLRSAGVVHRVSDGQAAGFIVACRANLVEELPERHDLRFI